MATCYHSLSIVVPLIVILCFSLSLIVLLVATRCLQWSLVVIRCATFTVQNFRKNLINNQKQPSEGVLWKSCCEIFRKSHRETSMVEGCDFSTQTTLQRVCFPVNFQKILSTGFWQNTSGLLLPNNVGSTKNQKKQ